MHQSIITFVWLILAIILGIEISSLVQEENKLELFTNIILGVSSVSVVTGLYLYFKFDDYLNLRFLSTFFEPNAYAGFLLLPLCLLFSYFISTKDKFKKNILGFISVFTLSALILTRSRGAILIFCLVSILFLIIFLLKRRIKIKSFNLFQVLFIIVISLFVSFFIYEFKMSYDPKAVSEASSASVLPQGGATSLQAVSSRIEYMKTGMNITKFNLISGVGFGAYKEAEIKYRDNVIYETNDPHNLYIRIFSEVGVVGGFSFSFLIFILLVWIFYKIYKTDVSHFQALDIGLIMGGVCIILHNVIDVDWYFPANMFISIITFFVLFSVLQNKDKNMFLNKNENFVRYMFMFLVSIFMVISILNFLGNNTAEDANYFISKDSFDDASLLFDKAIGFDRYNPEILYDYAFTLFNKSKINLDNKSQLLNKALTLIDRAIKIKPFNFTYLSLRADIYKALGDNISYENNLLQSIGDNKTLNLDAYIKLNNIYLQQKQYQKVVDLVDGVLVYYPSYIFRDPFWASPDKNKLNFELSILKLNRLTALDNLKKKL